MKRLYKNTITLSISGTLVKFISTINGIIIARYFGPEIFGIFSIAREFSNIFSPITDFGSSTYFIKEGSIRHEKVSDYLGELIIFKLFLSIIILVFCLTIAKILYPPSISNLICFFIFAMIGFYYFSLLYNVFMIRNVMINTAISQIVFSVLLLAVVLFTVLYDKNIYFIVGGRLIVTIISVIVLYIIIRKNYGIKYNTRDFGNYIRLIKNLLPYGGYVILFYIYSRISIIILSKVTSNIQVGYFSSAYQIILGIYFIPTAFFQALFPTLSRNYKYNKQHFNTNIDKTLNYIGILGISIASFIFIFSFNIIKILYGTEYIYSYKILQIGAFSFFFRCISTILADALTTSDNQKYRLKIMFINVLVIIPLSLVFSYLFSSYGTIVAILIAEIVSSFLYIKYVNKYVKSINIFNIFKIPLIVILLDFLIYLTILKYKVNIWP